ncbi:Peptidoglycan/LPS O-acetylase OafA/YrhL, contains acyltransferase and SGNH-hydrolase domains [Sanguibacter gelidistatuariae]|uniref:Peptidoglycan/LPS O-acetylase OafA/YrhL, contains acyltransferase and SGNH-hydrolase domains n=2 Tax=Sanguibacter gelidistatuariae TaxID=1814289 RepID=A0A1G6QR09_9MICO|nr:Peptidoglycan/LPS O-acetylase OafA/YrhL, contains acyltransferase and SGNH-hydrolase domains [Sanguibacter gelidistatuariae]
MSVAPPRQAHGSRFRPDIEGMRAVAIGLVLFYHAGLPWIPGGFVGVDVFFVISGFLITGLLLREIAKTGRISLPTFYARRAKRLLPATALVLVATAALTYIVLPVTDRRVFGWDIVSAAAYVANWRFADRSVDYLAEGIGASPVQHFWSLAVEEQFYLVWPILIVAVLLVSRRVGRSPRILLGPALLLVAVPSFLWSVTETGHNPEAAFFATPTRLWELAVGAGVALALPHIRRLPVRHATILAATGLSAVALSALLFDADTAWPGHLALVPVLGTAAVLAGGEVARDAGAGRLLSAQPMVWVGGLSYSLYLWHWPLLIAATAYWNDDLGVGRGVAIVALSVVPAWLSLVLVENPVRFAQRLKSTSLSLSVGANFTAVGVAAGLVLVLVVPSTATDPVSSPPPGAEVVRDDPAAASSLWEVTSAQRIVPSPETATLDVPVSYAEGCQQDQATSNVVLCEYGDGASEHVIALVGDSKALQWQPVLDQLATAHGWRLVTMTKSSCGLYDGATGDEAGIYSSCVDWNSRAVEEITALRPDVVLTSQYSSAALTDPEDSESEATDEGMVAALESRWAKLADSGIPVIALTNNPSPTGEVYECVAENLENLSACSFPGTQTLTAEVQREAARLVPGTRVLDMNDVICPDGMCPAVMGEVLVYRQASHLTKTFVESTKNILEPRLIEALETAAPEVDW